MGADAEKSLNAKIYRRDLDDLVKEKCVFKTTRLGPAIDGKAFLEVFPLSDIDAIEIQGDEVTLPSALVRKLFQLGRFGKNVPISVIDAPCGRVRLKDGNCFQFNVLLDPADRSVHGVEMPIGSLLPADPSFKTVESVRVKKGMRRAEVEKLVHVDGGISVPFKYERYILTDSNPGHLPEATKINIAFKPAGMSDTVYFLGKWVVGKMSPDDVVMRISPPYREAPYFD